MIRVLFAYFCNFKNWIFRYFLSVNFPFSKTKTAEGVPLYVYSTSSAGFSTLVWLLLLLIKTGSPQALFTLFAVSPTDTLGPQIVVVARLIPFTVMFRSLP